MTYYTVDQYTKGAGTFVDTGDEQIAIETLLDAYLENSEYAFVLYKDGDDPTHIVLYDVLYKLIEIPDDKRLHAPDMYTHE